MDSHKKKSKVIFALIMALSMMLYLISPLLPNNVIAEQNDDKLVRLEHTNAIDEYIELCIRTIEGEITFTRPLVQKYIDLVIVQDASGSFANTIGTMKNGLKAVVDKLNATNGDRVMVTTYQNGNRYQWYKIVGGQQQKDGSVKTGSGGTWAPVKVQTRYALGNNFPAAKTAIQDITVNGATPTARGLQYALQQYNSKRTSLGDTGDLMRETVFLLVTDGVANVRLPDGTSGDDGTLWLDKGQASGSNPGFNEKYQDYKTAIDQAGGIANQIKGQGYYFISTFIQDETSLRSQYGQNYYDNTVGPYTQAALQAMATSNDYYVVFDNPTNFGATVGNLFDQLVEEISQEWIEVEIEPGYQVIESKLLKDGAVINSNLGLHTGTNNVSVDQDGDYVIQYKLQELDYYGSDKTPVKATGRSGQKRYEIDNPIVPGNENTVCALEPTAPVKKVNGAGHVDLLQVREEVTYQVTTRVENIFNMTQFGFEDKVDDLLAITPGSVDVKVDGASIVKPGELTIIGNKITFLKQSDFQQIKGKDVTLEFKATIDACVLCGEVHQQYEDGKIPNEATLIYNNSRVDSNTVTIKPPAPEQPQISKDVNGKTHENLTAQDQVFTYKVKVLLPQQPEGEAYQELIISDTLESVLDIVSYRALVDNVEDTQLNAFITIVAQTVTLSITDSDVDFDDYIGKVIALEIEAKIKDEADLSSYTDDKIPNEGSYVVNGLPAVKSNTVTVTPPADIPDIEKEVNGEEQIDLQAKDEQFTYHVNVKIPERIHGYDTLLISDTLEPVLELVSVKVLVNNVEDAGLYALVSVAGQTVNLLFDSTFDFNQIAGKTLTLAMEAKIRENANLDDYVNDTVPNEASFILNDQAKVDSNIVYVTPPAKDPSIVKDVNGKTHEDLESDDEQFTYHVAVTLPNNVRDIEQFVIRDLLESVLDIKNVTVWVDGVEDLGLKSRVAVSGQEVSLTLTANDLGQYAKKTITLVIDAQIKDGADLGEYENDTIPNKGSYQIGNKPEIESNTVTVTPPVDDPTIEKDVDGVTHKDLETVNEEYFYNVHVDVPENIRGYESILISDTLETVLEILDVKVLVDSVEDEDLTDLVGIDDWKVSLVLHEEDIEDVAGKRLTLVIKARIKAGADLNEYADGKVPNDAMVKINDHPAIDSNVVTVKPPIDEPTITKTVNDKEHEDLTSYDQVFTYQVHANIPTNVSQYESFVIQDSLEGVLAIQDVRVLLDGVQSALLTPYLTVIGQTVTLALDDAFDYLEIAGHKVTLVIEAKIKEDADLSEYLDKTVPNDALLILNDQLEIESNVVTVTPPLEEPEVEKHVNRKQHVDLKTKDEVFTYHVHVIFPESVRGYESVLIRDTLEDVLEIVDVSVRIDGFENVLPASYISVIGQTVEVALDETFDFESHAGLDLTLVIEARIKEGADLSEYIDETVPNGAIVIINDAREIESNVVTVTPPVEDPVISKDVNGKEHETLGNKNDIFSYHVKVRFPENVRGYESFTISDTLEAVLEIQDVKVLLNGVEDAELGAYLTVVGQHVELTVSEYDFEKIADATVVLVIEAKIRSGESLSEYEGKRVPNEAHYVLNDEPEVKSNIVTVKPPDDVPPPPPIEDPDIVKDVNGKTHEVLSARDQLFTYHVNVDIPMNIQGYTDLVIQDQLEEVLSLENVKVLLNGTDSALLNSHLYTLSGTVKLLLGSSFDYSQIAGGTVTLVIDAKIKNDADLSAYSDGRIPNIATVTLNNDPAIDSNVVTVTPPAEDPVIEKDVNGKLHEELEEKETPFVYHVHVDIPTNVQGYNRLVIRDELEEVLFIREVKVLVDGIEDVALTSKVSAHDHLVELLLDEHFDYTTIAGKRLTLVIEVNIEHGADLDDYLDWTIPNTAKVALNDHAAIESNEVTVHAPDEIVLGDEELPSTGGYLDKTILWIVGVMLMMAGAVILIQPKFKKEP